MSKHLPRGVFMALLAALGLSGILLIGMTTRWGAGLMDDAFIYITSAQNLAAGNGLAWPWGDGSLKPMTYFPPLFPLILAGFEALGVDAAGAARWLNAVLFGASVMLAGLLGCRAAGSDGFGLLAAGLALASDTLIEVHSWAMSEALYIFLALAGLYSLSRAIEEESKRWLAAAALALGLGFLTRYIGFSLILTGLAALILLSRAPLRERLARAAWFAAGSLLPMALWMMRNLATTGGAIDRTAGWYLVTLGQLQKAANTLLLWFLPGRLVHGRELLVLLGVGAGLAALAWLLARRQPAEAAQSETFARLRWILALQAFFHVGFLLVSKSFFEPSTPLNDRILSPILPSLLILFTALLAGVWRAWNAPAKWGGAVRLAVVAAALAFSGFYVLRAADLAPRLYNSGLGLARKGWRNSDTLVAVRQLPPAPIFSNSPAGIYLWTGRPAYPVYSPDLIREQATEQGAFLVLFNSISLDLYDVTQADVTQGLILVESFQDGSIYAAGSAP